MVGSNPAAPTKKIKMFGSSSGLGFKIFILAIGVRIPYRLQLLTDIIFEMANHKSALKRIRQTESKRLNNRYYGKTTRNAIKKFRMETNKEEAEKMYPEVVSMIDKLAKRNVIHKNKASNLKSKLALQINSL